MVRTDSGTELVVFRQNNERVSDAGVPGTRVQLEWSAEFNVVLTDGIDTPTTVAPGLTTGSAPDPDPELDLEHDSEAAPRPTEVHR